MANQQVSETLGVSDIKGLIPRLRQVISEHGHAINLFLVALDEGSNVTPLVDGITAPAAIPGVAQIYIDIADGDCKIMFGDGTVKTLATNP